MSIYDRTHVGSGMGPETRYYSVSYLVSPVQSGDETETRLVGGACLPTDKCTCLRIAHCLLRLSCRSSFSLLRASRRLSSSPVCKAMDVKLRLVQFECEGAGGRVRLGAELSDGRVVDFSSADAEDALSCDMQGFLEQWESSKTRAARCTRGRGGARACPPS